MAIDNAIENINKAFSLNEYLIEYNISLIKLQYLKKSNILRAVVKVIEEVEENIEGILKGIILKKLPFVSDVDLLIYRDLKNVTLDEICSKYWSDIINNSSFLKALTASTLNHCIKKVDNNSIFLYVENEFIGDFLKGKKINMKLEESIYKIFGRECKIYFKPKYEDSHLHYDKFKKKEDKEIFNKIKNNLNNRMQKSQVAKEASLRPVKQKTYNRSRVQVDKNIKDEDIILGKGIKGEVVSIDNLDESFEYPTIKGDVIKVDAVKTKNGRYILTLFLTDYTNSVIVKVWSNENTEENLLNSLKKGIHIKVRGRYGFDTFAKENVIMARDINKAKKDIIMDNEEEKRVELHAHTHMSAMDSMVSAGKLIERAALWGHKAVAITDHGVVQAYPEAMDSAKKHKIKVLYGVEGYLVDDEEPMIKNLKGGTIDDEFVVFDIETTGFSNKNDKIIEIGAVKIRNGEIVDTFSSFVNPEIPIPYKIIELTGITDEMVKDAKKIRDVIKEFYNYSKDSVLVAHNAAFDVGFIKKNYKDYNIDFNNTVIDTIPLAKLLYKDLKRYKLNVVCKHLGISLENHHRAVDDAIATAEIFKYSIKKLKKLDYYTLEDINKYNSENIDVKKLNTFHIILFAKNQVGLKNIYNLVSQSNLSYFHRKPRIPKSLLKNMREGIIIGSACESGEVYRAILDNRFKDEIDEIVSFYDYLEIQPVANNKFLIEKGNVTGTLELQDINKRIYNIGKEHKKLVVATGDVHFLDMQDEIFRRILLSGQGFSDADNQPPLYFKTTKEMLDEFSYLGRNEAREVVIINTNKIADSIDNVKPIPDETYPPKIEGAEEQIREMTLKKVHSIYGDNLPEVIQKRLDKELNSIINNGYAVLYLIAQKLVAKSYKDGYLVGSRGSVGSSFVATMSDITEVNGLPPHYVCPKCKKSEFIMDGSVNAGVDLPIKNCPDCKVEYLRDGHDIPFETFLGFEGDKEPDIDLNFSGDNQGDIHKYCEVLFGEGKTFKAGTIGTVAEKTAYGFVRKYLDEREIKVSIAEIERLTLGCTGVKRTSGQHPGGIMVVPSDNDIHNFTPVQRPADDPSSDIITTHFDYHSISGRLLKLDILGHDDPTVLRMLQDLTGIDPKTIPLSDEKVISLFTSPEALGLTREELGCEVGSYGLPEFGTKFVRQMLVDTQPKTFSDLVRISGLSHGTDVWLNNAQYYIKEGYTTLKDCISTRDDIMVYLIYKGLPEKDSFTIMERVRKGKGLSKEQEDLMRQYNVQEWYIESCKKIKYMFPKGHAAAYCMMAVRVAYFKVYYPKEYYATYFTVRADDFDGNIVIKGEGAIKQKIDELNNDPNISTKDKGLLTTLELCYEMYKRGIKFIPIDIYTSDPVNFIVEGDNIRLPISSLNGVGENAAKSIALVRDDGEFLSKEDLIKRSKVSKTVVESLDIHGCLNSLPDTNQLSLFNL